MYAHIRCIPPEVCQQAIYKKMKEMDLYAYREVQARKLSGGNKRKLSTAIATLSNPKVIFLDEPSTGMDPEARRFMWNIISRIATKKK